ncbi:MAG: DUF1565 domain-containing protein [Deltaproteobacteria bacterium]|nr:DUF1565 domain-containing protein [Deltaproteobacteria bacterium]
MKATRWTVILGAAILAAGCGSASGASDDVADVDTDGTDGTGDVDLDAEGGGDADDDGTADDAEVDLDGDGGADADGADGDGDGGADGDADGTDATDVPVGECAGAGDCAPLYGAAPCGAWECNLGACEVNCPGCTDADRDGYGTGAAGACAGPDCDDADDAVADVAVTSCYSGATGTEGVGACREGTLSCTAGVWGPCTGEVTPGGEACNLEDDDCDGLTDEVADLGSFTCGIGACTATVPACTAGVVGTCVPGTPGPSDGCGGGDEDCDGAIDENCSTCVPVSPSGNDGSADGTTALPFRTIQAAINWAAAVSTRPRIVCVAAGAACGNTATYPESVTMSDGISVYGNYATATWARCTNSTTIIQPARPEGVLFPDTIVLHTVLDGFRIDRFTAATTAAVTLDGAQNAILSGLVINNTPVVTNSYGVNLVNGAAAVIMTSRVDAGTGTSESIAVRSVGSTPRIVDNCQGYDSSGRCNILCGSTGPAFRGRSTTGTGTTYGILLQDSPGAVVERTAVCAIDADTGAAIRIAGDATGIVIRACAINAWGGALDSHGIWMEDCGGASPWIVDNTSIAAAGDSSATRTDGVRAIGDCHPVIDSNVLITGGGEGGTSGANGVHCGANASGTPSRCAVLGNTRIEGSQFGFPPTSVGVRCDDGSCLRISDNLITGRGGILSWGVYLDNTGAFVDDNAIDGGCASTAGIGVYAEDSWARLQNNRILGGSCAGSSTVGNRYVGLDVRLAAGINELDVHSNAISGQGNAGGCTSTGVSLDAGLAGPGSPSGVFRNNIVRAGACATARDFVEASVVADPRIFENNDLDPTGSPSALYFDENLTALTTVTQVDALSDITVGGTLSADPLFAGYAGNLHIGAGSPCDGAGTPVGAPTYDMDGQPRSATAPDVGADEI